MNYLNAENGVRTLMNIEIGHSVDQSEKIWSLTNYTKFRPPIAVVEQSSLPLDILSPSHLGKF